MENRSVEVSRPGVIGSLLCPVPRPSQVPEPVDIIPRARRELWIPTEVADGFQHETKVQTLELRSQE